MADHGTESDYSDSSVSSTDSSFSSSSSEESINQLELTKIENNIFQLPKGICENPAIFREFFSMETWQSLPPNFQAYLKNKFLPHFAENNELEQERILQMLFSNELDRFGRSPLVDLQRNLEEGNYRPDVLKLRQNIAKSRRREQRFEEYDRISQLAKNLMISREKKLRSSYISPPSSVLKINTGRPQFDESITSVRARKRFHKEIVQLANEIEFDGKLSEYEDDDVKIDKKNDVLSLASCNDLKIVSTMRRRDEVSIEVGSLNLNGTNHSFKKVLLEHKRRKLEDPNRPEFDTNDIRLRDVHARTQMSITGKRVFASGKTPGRKPKIKSEVSEIDNISKDSEIEPHFVKDEPIAELNLTASDTIRPALIEDLPPSQATKIDPASTHISIDQIPVTNNESSEIFMGESESDEDNKVKVVEISTLNTEKEAQPVSIRAPAELMISEANTTPSRHLSHYHGKTKVATLLDLEGIDMMHLPVDLDDSDHIDLMNQLKPQNVDSNNPELMQETHACFLSLVRDIFCSTPNHRIKLDKLKEKINIWLSNPITALNDWYPMAESWLVLVTSAVNFLAGDYSEQPEEFVPYIEYKSQLDIYQWIGAGRDSDNRLVQLCNYWMARKHEMENKPSEKVDLSANKLIELEDNFSNERIASPPPPRFPTSWSVCPATADEMEEFRAQERIRFEYPHRAFTYRQHGYESVVGPVKGIYTNIVALTKARGHNMLIGDRPNFVTILTLVRDATARLPNGEGTRAEICELLKSSQYVNTEAPEAILQTIVSGALDRMHTEHDPCVRYDTKRKIWIYLHRNRTEEEFEKMHQQYQGVGKHKKPQNRKPKKKYVGERQSTENANSVSSSPENSPVSVVKATLVTSSQSPTITQIPIALRSIANSGDNSPLQSPPPPPPLKLSISQSPILQKSVMKPVRIMTAEQSFVQSPQSTPEKIELIDTTDVAMATSSTSPVNLLNQKSSRMQRIITSSPNSKSSNLLNLPCNTTQIRVATPSGIQTVNVSVATTPTISSVPNSNTPEQRLTSSQIITPTKNLAKSIIINQAMTQQHQSTQGQDQSQQSFIVPIKINSSDQFKMVSTMPSLHMSNSNLVAANMMKTRSGVPATLVNSPQTRIFQQSQQGVNVSIARNISRVSLGTQSNQGSKSLISPHIAANNITLQQQKFVGQQQKVQTVTSAIRNSQQHSMPSGGISMIDNVSRPIKISSQNISNIQQKQIIQNLLSQQNQQQSNPKRIVSIGNLGGQNVIIPNTQCQTPQQPPSKNIFIQQTPQGQKIINVSAASVGTVSSGNNTTGAQNLVSPQIIQIHSAPGSQGTHGKVHAIDPSNLTSQQQQTILQSLKQQQLKTISSNPVMQISPQLQKHQSLIIKQQPIMAKQQKQQVIQSPSSLGINVRTPSPKNVSTIVAQGVSNVIPATPSGQVHATLLQQQQDASKPIAVASRSQATFARVIKPIQNQTAGRSQQPGSPLMAKVLTNTAGQIISLENLLQKQNNSMGTVRITNAKQSHNLVQLAAPAVSSITQYTLVSPGRNIISVGSPQQRMVTTHAQVASGTNPSSSTTTATSSRTTNSTGAPAKMISANQIQPISTPQLVTAKVINKTIPGQTGIRMLNTSNFSISNLRGKPVIIASKSPNNQQASAAGQNVFIQNPMNRTNVVIGGQALKLQGNVVSPSNIQVLDKAPSSSQQQTVVVGNQILKLQPPNGNKQQHTHIISSSLNNPNTSASINTVASANGNTILVNSAGCMQKIPKTVMLGTSGQSIRIQQPQQLPTTTTGTTSQGQPLILGTTVKGAPVKTATNNQQRVVLAVQGGGQILLPPGFHAGTLNLKSLQGLKVVSINQQQQQQNKNKKNS